LCWKARNAKLTVANGSWPSHPRHLKLGDLALELDLQDFPGPDATIYTTNGSAVAADVGRTSQKHERLSIRI